MIFVPIVLMIRQPPVKVPRAIALAALTTTHVGTWKPLLEISPWAIKAKRDHPHGLLGVVGPVGQGEKAAGSQLTEAEAMANRSRPQPSHDPVDAQDPQPGGEKGDQRRHHCRHDQFGQQAMAVDRGETLGGDHRSNQAADQGV